MTNPQQGWHFDVSEPPPGAYGFTSPPPAPRQVHVFVEGPNHALHFALSMLTCGLWLPVWVLVAIGNRKTVRTLPL